MRASRIEIPSERPFANNNIVSQYAIQKARWIEHPEADDVRDQFYEYELNFELKAEASFVIHVSADQRFEIFCDGEYIGMGPDRSDLRNWSFHSYEIALPAGPHRFRASVYYIATHRPHAQASRQPAFILASDNAPVQLNTGEAEWTVSRREGVTCSTPSFSDKWYQVVGPNYAIDGAKFFAPSDKVCPTLVPETNLQGGHVGFVREGWRLYPSRLPEQLRTPVGLPGRLRMLQEGVPEQMTENIPETATAEHGAPAPGSAWTFPAGATRTMLWDLEEYYCAYPRLKISGGKAAEIRWEWAEACYEDAECRRKSDRNRIEGMHYEGYGDTFVSGGGEESFTSFWWRAGRYIRLTVKVADEELSIEDMGIEESRLPLENEGEFSSNDAGLDAIIPLAVRGIQMCAHETYMDCPYYEQMMYVGDARLQLLTSCTISSESRLHQRALEMLDWSRHVSDFVLMRHPSHPRQLSTTFAMVWIMMIRDLAWWQRDEDVIAERLPGMRAQLEQFRALADERMLLSGLPGWSFIDWVQSEGWDFAYPPEGKFGLSGINNLFFLLTLRNAIDIEEAYGEKQFADNYRQWAKKLAVSIYDVFWDADRGVFADDPAHKYLSEHAQCLAILSGCCDEPTVEQCFESLITRDDLARTTIYFSFYLLEVFYRRGRGDLILEKMAFWKNLVSQGFKAPVEQPEPSRSDCHAWGSHPLFHMYASLCGIRPASAGFETVRIVPQPGGLKELKCRVPHPDGFIDFELLRADDCWKVSVGLPAGLNGVFEFEGQSLPLQGTMKFDIPIQS